MTKTFVQDTTTTTQTDISQKELKKQRKKLAKREAKVMLKLEQARKDTQKTEQKLAKVQSKLEEQRKYAQQLEDELKEVRSSSETVDATGKADANHSDHQDTTDTQNLTAISSAEQSNAEPAVEVRYGIFAEQDAVHAHSPDDTSLASGSAPADEASAGADSKNNPHATTAKTQQEAAITPPTNQIASEPPVEGRDDIQQEQSVSQPEAAGNSGKDTEATEDTIATVATHDPSVSPLPVEGRADILPEDDASKNQDTDQTEQAHDNAEKEDSAHDEEHPVQSESNPANNPTSHDDDEAETDLAETNSHHTTTRRSRSRRAQQEK
jgi:hypothetical protein